MPQSRTARSGSPAHLRPRWASQTLALAVALALPVGLAAQDFKPEPPTARALAIKSQIAADLNAKPKRTKRQKTALWLMGIGSAVALAGYLEDSESRCRPGLEHSYLGYDCYADTPRELHYRGGNDDVVYGGVGLAILGLVIGMTGRKADDPEAFSMSFGPVAGEPGLGRPNGLAVSVSFRVGGRR